MRVAYLGSPAIAVPPLEALVESGHEIAVVITNPDRRRSRGKELHPTPVKAAAQRLAIPVSHEVDDVLDAGVDLGVVVAYGHLIGDRILDAVPMVNVHFSLLPRWRGAAPLERAILAGDEVTGVCLMQIVSELDAGAVFDRVEVPIGDKDLDALRADLVAASCDLLVDALASGLGEPEPQVGEVTYARKLTADDFRLDWTRPAGELERVVRLGRAFTTIDDKRLRILAAAVDPEAGATERPGTVGAAGGSVWVATGEGRLKLERVQPEGRKPVGASDWRRGVRAEGDLVLGS